MDIMTFSGIGPDQDGMMDETERNGDVQRGCTA